MVETFQHVVVGTVEGEAEIYDEQFSPDHLSGPGLPGLPYAVYTLAIEDVVSSELIKPGDRVPVFLVGSNEAYGGVPVLPNEVLPAGTTYLLFMIDGRPLDLPGFQALRFVISSDGYLLPNGLECQLGGPAEVSGITEQECRKAMDSANPLEALGALKTRTVDEAKAMIVSAIAEAPLPPTYTPYATPAPSAEATPALSPDPSSAPSAAP
jgi:hypothetical protein